MDLKISVIGSTGSIGRQTLDVAENLGIQVEALSANSKVDMIEAQARKFRPKFIAMGNEKAAKELRTALGDMDVKIGWGDEALTEAAAIDSADCLVTAVSGSVGLKPTLAAIEKKKRIAFANKETLVCSGTIMMKKVRECGAELLPVDSEHSAIFQCLQGRKKSELNKILLTGSGGPFRGRKWSELKDITPADALKHPTWNMGAKISIDSATMMNKGLEFIEAMHLFEVSPQDIKVVIHPQSVIHSMVELVDGTVIAQLGCPDMRLPIQNALTYPERTVSQCEHLNFAHLKDLSFEAPNYENTPCLKLAMDCAKLGGIKPCVMSAANEVAVHMFLRGELSYTEIYDAVSAAVAHFDGPAQDIDVVIEADREAREFVNKNFGRR